MTGEHETPECGLREFLKREKTERRDRERGRSAAAGFEVRVIRGEEGDVRKG